MKDLFLLFWQDQNEEENWASWWYSFFQDESWHFLVLHAMLVFCWRRSDLTRILKFGCDWVEWNMNHGQTYAFLLNVNPHFFLALRSCKMTKCRKLNTAEWLSILLQASFDAVLRLFGCLNCGKRSCKINKSITQCLKITEKVSFKIASEVSYVYVSSG